MVKFALVRLLNPAHPSRPPSTRADVWRDVVVARFATVVALAVALAALELSRPAVAWGGLLGAALLIPVLSSKAAASANAVRRTVDDVLESVDTIVWES